MPSEEICQFECFVNLPRDKAFALLVDDVSSWWIPVSGGSSVQDAAVEPHAGGTCYEMTAEHGHLVWGTVLSIEPPLYIRLAWQVTPDGHPIRDPAAASRVMITLRGAGDGTRLEVIHSDFLRHGEQAVACRDAVSGPQGWPRRLNSLKAAAEKLRR